MPSQDGGTWVIDRRSGRWKRLGCVEAASTKRLRAQALADGRRRVFVDVYPDDVRRLDPGTIRRLYPGRRRLSKVTPYPLDLLRDITGEQDLALAAVHEFGVELHKRNLNAETVQR